MNDNKDNKDFENKTTSIHTLETDLASAVRDDDYGKNIIKIITNPDNNSIIQVKNDRLNGFSNLFSIKNIVIFSILILLFSAVGVILFILNKAKNPQSNDTEPLPIATTTNTSIQNPIITNNNILNPEIIQSSDFSNFNRFEIINEINKIKQLLIDKKIEPNNNIGINTNLNTVQFFEKIRYSGDESFLRSLDSSYAFGLYSVADNRFETYMLIQVNNFDLAFKSILGWEKYMSVDLGGIFIGNNEVKIDNLQSTTSTIKYSKKNTIGFVDRILKNYDIREYVNNEANTNIIYGFINNKYLLVTSGESSFIDIKDRLLKENIVR